jgi:hypothetical protein
LVGHCARPSFIVEIKELLRYAGVLGSGFPDLVWGAAKNPKDLRLSHHESDRSGCVNHYTRGRVATCYLPEFVLLPSLKDVFDVLGVN